MALAAFLIALIRSIKFNYCAGMRGAFFLVGPLMVIIYLSINSLVKFEFVVD